MLGQDDDRSGEVTLPKYIEVDSQTKLRRTLGSAVAQCTDIAPEFSLCSVSDPTQHIDSGKVSNASSSVAQNTIQKSDSGKLPNASSSVAQNTIQKSDSGKLSNASSSVAQKTIQTSESGKLSNASSSVAQMSQISAVSDQSSTDSTISSHSSIPKSIPKSLFVFNRSKQQDLKTISEISGPVIDDGDHCINLCGHLDSRDFSTKGSYSDTRQSTSSELIVSRVQK